jgi:uncharacterized UPF0160 family protein
MQVNQNNKDKTDKKYLKAIQFIKNELDENNNHSVSKLVSNQQINIYWGKFLTRHNIVYYDYETCSYKWNEKIPPSAKLVQKFREEFISISKNRNPQQEIKFIERQEMKSIQIPPEIKRRRRTPSVVVEQTPQPQVGLIRRFLRWLY